MPGVFNVERLHQLPTAGLMYFSGAHVNIYVNYVASIMFDDFKLSVNGQRNVALTLSNLPYVETADDRLTLGWGPDNVIRQPEVHRYGYEHLTVMVALASTFHESYAAEVCHAYAAAMAREDDMVPHIRQWKSQCRFICGALSASSFAQLVEEYIRLDPYQVGPGSNLLARRCRVEPKAMAKALMALSTVISKKQKEVTMVGGAVIGWFAALAELFYDLKVAILARTGEKLHGDFNDKSTQVILVYHEDPTIEVLTDHWSTITDNKEDDDPFWTRHVHYLPFGGRVQWPSLLPQVFGRAFYVLDHEESRTLADLIGGCARGLEGDYEIHKAEGGELHHTSPANESAYGAGLIQNLTGWLPELRRGQGRMERQLRRDVHAAADTYDEMIAHLGKLCNCTVCTTTGSEKPPEDGYCLPVICETIMSLGLAISRMTVASGIYPAREGVQGLYAAQAERRKEAKFLDLKTVESRVRHFNIIYANEWRAGNCRRLQNAIELFSGCRPEADLHDGLVAIAHEGICAYMVNLKSGRERPGTRGFIEVTSGAVNVRQKVFTRVCAEPVKAEADDREGLSWEEATFAHLEKPLYCK